MLLPGFPSSSQVATATSDVAPSGTRIVRRFVRCAWQAADGMGQEVGAGPGDQK